MATSMGAGFASTGTGISSTGTGISSTGTGTVEEVNDKVSFSCSEKLASTESLSKRRSLYSSNGLVVLFFGRSIPITGNRHSIGATQQSTIVNSSLMKNGFSPNIGAIERRLSRNSLRAFSNCAGVPLLAIIASTFPHQSCLMR